MNSKSEYSASGVSVQSEGTDSKNQDNVKCDVAAMKQRHNV